MSLVLPADVLAIMSPGVTGADLQAVIDREEAALAARIGPLTGSRTVTLHPAGDLDLPLFLPRSTDATDRTDVDVFGFQLERNDGGLWTVDEAFVFTPNDEAQVKLAILDLIRLTVTSSPYSQESTEGHSDTRRVDVSRARENIYRSLGPKLGPTSVRTASR